MTPGLWRGNDINVCSLVCVGRRSSGCKHKSPRLFLHGIGAKLSVMSGRRDAMIQTNKMCIS